MRNVITIEIFGECPEWNVLPEGFELVDSRVGAQSIELGETIVTTLIIAFSAGIAKQSGEQLVRWFAEFWKRSKTERVTFDGHDVTGDIIEAAYEEPNCPDEP